MIHFFVESIDFTPLPLLSSVPDWLNQVVEHYDQSIQEINLIFCSDNYLLAINQQYLSHDYYTDIVTFDNRELSNQPLESDIFISIDRVRENAQNLNVIFFHELLRVIVHGVLHLLGFTDTSDTHKLEMRTLESKLVQDYFQNFHSS